MLYDEGYYWFLHPLFEKLLAETDQYIDLYGDARFEGFALDALERMLADAAKQVRKQPPRWKVYIGTQGYQGKRSELYYEVEKSRLLDLLSQWKAVIARAKELSRAVVCFGD